MTWGDTSSRLSTLLDDPKHRVLVAQSQDSALLGWIAAEQRISLESGARAEITGLVVCPRTRRKGVGKLLVAATEQWASARGLSLVCVRSNTVRSESHGFCPKIGYRHVKSQHVYTKDLWEE